VLLQFDLTGEGFDLRVLDCEETIADTASEIDWCRVSFVLS
jgi:hypothetical protein